MTSLDPSRQLPSLANARPDLRRSLVTMVTALSCSDALDLRSLDRFMLVGWLERKAGRIRLTETGNLVYACEVRRLRDGLDDGLQGREQLLATSVDSRIEEPH